MMAGTVRNPRTTCLRRSSWWCPRTARRVGGAPLGAPNWRRTRCPFVPLLPAWARPAAAKSHLADDLLTWAAIRGSVCAVTPPSGPRWARPMPAEPVRCDLLIVEDLHTCRPKAIDAFAALLDYRIVRPPGNLLTASHGPAEWRTCPARLANRLTGGLVVGLEAAGPKSRRRFLAKRGGGPRLGGSTRCAEMACASHARQWTAIGCSAGTA